MRTLFSAAHRSTVSGLLLLTFFTVTVVLIAYLIARKGRAPRYAYVMAPTSDAKHAVPGGYVPTSEKAPLLSVG